jgi:GT2 family glycosyltransferase
MNRISRKDTIIALCSPDINRRVAKIAVSSVKNTNLDRAELLIIDNAYDNDFSHPEIMNQLLKLAANRNMSLVFLDDDVEIYETEWLNRIHQTAKDLKADIVSCIQTFPTGEINSIGEYWHANGLTEPITDFIHDPAYILNHSTYSPLLCSAMMLIKTPKNYYIDLNYKKYKQDLDICMQAWELGTKVAVALDVRIIHNRGYTGEFNQNFNNILMKDSITFATKWRSKLDRFLNIEELNQYKSSSPNSSWRNEYNFSSRRKLLEPDIAIYKFKWIAEHCYIDVLSSGAWYHLYTLENELEYLINCLNINPCHRLAQRILFDNGIEFRPICKYFYDCKSCIMR